MSEISALLEANRAFAATNDVGGRPMAPRRPLAILTCIDARLHPEEFLGLQIGDAHVLRNAGGRASDDALRSLIVSSWLLGTREFLVIHHTDCGMTVFTNDALVQIVKDGTGGDVSSIDFLTFSDLDEGVREDVERVRALGDKLPDGVSVAGYVYDVETGGLREVSPVS